MRVVGLCECLEHLVVDFLWYSASRVSDTEQQFVRLIRVRANRKGYLAGLSEFDRISDEIDNDLPQSPPSVLMKRGTPGP